MPRDFYDRRTASKPNSGNSKRWPCHALSDRTIHRNSIAKETRMPNIRKTMAAATLESNNATIVKMKKTVQSVRLCTA